ncbi:alanine dehydrogenase [Erysipelothrix larvae]|uniref:Alanine dehydrogenase n=1 Tax=Erysipelothrix larvae TaxID=1514105 RepID=A0A0X8GYQ5_9FIRM|nr:alanine dehydrogenase [Erysipelothrix larvae]AMC92872.1 alanine dehydrogenase [Erysipelothrix larvae]
MKVGCVKEIKQHEYRVGLTPDSVTVFVSHGHDVYIEKNAGLGSGFEDQEYIDHGAIILDKAEEVWELCDMIVKVKEPLDPEYKHIKEGQILFTYLHLAADEPLLDALLASKCEAVAYETITDRNGRLPLLKPMSEIAGRLSIQEGAHALEKPFGGRGVLLSGIPGVPRGNIVIVGAGVVGLNALQVAVGMEANVTVLDVNLDRLTEIDTLYGNRVQTLYSTENSLKKALVEADLVIGSVLIPGSKAPKIIKKEYLKTMKPGSVIVDIAIDQGGCTETSRPTYHDNPTYVVDGVIHYCVANIPGAVARTSTIGLVNATLPYGLALADHGVLKASETVVGIKEGVNCYHGKITSKPVADTFNRPLSDLV